MTGFAGFGCRRGYAARGAIKRITCNDRENKCDQNEKAVRPKKIISRPARIGAPIAPTPLRNINDPDAAAISPGSR